MKSNSDSEVRASEVKVSKANRVKKRTKTSETTESAETACPINKSIST